MCKHKVSRKESTNGARHFYISLLSGVITLLSFYLLHGVFLGDKPCFVSSSVLNLVAGLSGLLSCCLYYCVPQKWSFERKVFVFVGMILLGTIGLLLIKREDAYTLFVVIGIALEGIPFGFLFAFLIGTLLSGNREG